MSFIKNFLGKKKGSCCDIKIEEVKKDEGSCCEGKVSSKETGTEKRSTCC